MTRLLAAGLVAAIAAPALADNWPQWRGPKNDGHSAETGLPVEWGPDKNVVWKFEMPGPGESTPCVWGDRIFLTTVAGDDIVLLCVGTDGKEKWRQALANTGKDRNGPDRATGASASCSTDGKHVWSYVGGQRAGRLTCHDLDGKLVWDKNLQEYGKFNIQFGTHWTPALYKGKLYLQVMHRGAQKLVRLDAATGTQEWAVDRRGAVAPRPDYGRGPESPDVYASALVWEGEGGPLLIAHGNDYCTAHKLDDGAEVWRVEGLNPRNDLHWRFVACPLVTPDLIVVPSCKNGPVVGVNPVGAKGAINPDNPAELWRINGTPDVVSPLRVGDIVYLCSNGPLTALDAKTGKQLYRESRPPQIHRANMVAADGKVYIIGREGKSDVVQDGPEFKRLAANALPDKFFASPAISGGRIYLRGYGYLWAIGSK
ncbi:MAG TPA: PQQ-binding-like beta-propeller repeat protein [Fimbriiglobus sp.]|nr:PQQ-binding-like beta-propeller repeat protein [Fimbriiglobus sp.]